MHHDLSHKVENKRILIVLLGTFQPNAGMFEYAKAWINLLLRNGWEVGFCGVPAVVREIDEACNKYELPVELDSGPNYYRRLAITSLINAGAAKRFVKSIINSIDQFQPSACHIVDKPIFIGYVIKRLAARRTNVFFVITLHDPIRHDEKISRVGNLICSHDDAKVIKLATNKNFFLHVHCKSLLHGSNFEQMKNIIEMPHPLPKTITTRLRREIHAGEVYPIRLGFFGRIEPYKGLDVLYDALLSGIQMGLFNGTRIELVIAGRGKITHTWDDLPIKVEIYNSNISDMNFHQLIADIDLLILPYKSATQSGVGMLGAAYRIPLIATKVGALHHLVLEGVNGHLIEPNRSDKLMECINKLVNTPENLVSLWHNSK